LPVILSAEPDRIVNKSEKPESVQTGEPILLDLLNRSDDAIMAFEAVSNSRGEVTDFNWLFANSKARAIAGLGDYDLSGSGLLKTQPVGLLASQFEKMVSVYLTGSDQVYEIGASKVRTEQNWLKISIQKTIFGITLSIQDVTSRKQEIRRTRKLNERLKVANSQKDKLFSIVAHDFRSPFAGCLGLLEMVLEDIDSFDRDELRKMLEMIHLQSQSTYNLLETLLEWAKIQQNRINFSPERLDLYHAVEMTLFALVNSARKKDIKLSNKVSKGITVNADKNMLRTVLANLISNGIKFTDNGGNIEISAEKKGPLVEVSVKDTGIGIKKNSLKRIFDIDYQYINKGTDGEKGSGLGLHVCRDYVGRHGGVMEVESQPGQGSTFRFTLPGKRVNGSGQP
jgi:signal transduction histidine kinase